MYFAKALCVCASLVASTIAQSSSSRIAFTVLPSSMTAGQDITLHWGGGDGSAVTLTLQQGTTDNLKTVSLVKGDATGTSYTWPVPKSLPNGDNYAFRIQQGDTEPNYTGMITVTGGSSSSASASSTAASSASAASTSATATNGSGGVIGGGSTGGNSSASHNSTVVATTSVNATTTVPAGTAASASGTGASVARNTTMSMATLSSTTSSASTTSSNPSVGGSGGSPTGSTSAPSPSKTGGAVALVASNFALLVCAVAGVVYLG